MYQPPERRKELRHRHKLPSTLTLESGQQLARTAENISYQGARLIIDAPLGEQLCTLALTLPPEPVGFSHMKLVIETRYCQLVTEGYAVGTRFNETPDSILPWSTTC